MAIKYNEIGSLNELLKKLGERGIYDFTTLDEIHAFRSGFQDSLNLIRSKNEERLLQDVEKLELECVQRTEELERVIKNRRESLEKEKIEISQEIAYYENPKNLFTAFFYWFLIRLAKRRKSVLDLHFGEEVKKPFNYSVRRINSLKAEYGDKKNNGNKWIELWSEPEISRKKFILSALDTNRNFFYGAEGEERALSVLEKLPDSYVIINNYCRQFSSPIYDRKNNDRIYSIQIDHIVVGPTGIYIIETKNWSQTSVENRDLFSPVKQLCRSSFAMFVLLNQAVKNGELNAFKRNWGDQKISPKNIILLMGHKPVEEFQYVKILSLDEINKHITYGSAIFLKEEVEELVNYLNSEMN